MKRIQRVGDGQNYYYIDRCLNVYVNEDWFMAEDNDHYKTGNYFNSKEEAEAMAKKLRAVLKGADVIEMPSEEDASFESAHLLGLSGHDDGERREEAYLDGFADCLHWIKSKVK